MCLQVSAGSQERGQLLNSVWGGLNSTLIASLLRLREQAALYKERWAADMSHCLPCVGWIDSLSAWRLRSILIPIPMTCCAMQNGCSGVYAGNKGGLAAEREQQAAC